ncbi:BTAD domain-containing putative transcriptional regulator [Actinoplanes sp. NPDC049548]|uniref:BTAD domain-containing putative transcriptional regulator n=1 Tax=Actinoplanes sp. NPDC049548 TaxID=3155152 RepID=UPI0034166182
MTAFSVLGPVGAGAVALKGARQRAVLARLLIARGHVVPVDRLVADLWEHPPEGAIGALRTFIADLRRALEPDRPPRAPAQLLVTEPPGYALRASPETVDAWRFEAAVARAGALLADDAGAALALLDEGLALWRGPAYAECAAEPWARAEIDRLDELRMLAVERRAEALLALGRSGEAVSELQAHTREQPLREDAWHLLARALYGSGRQGEALGALRRARDVLVSELGVDPGPRLRRLEADILAQAPHLDGSVAGARLDRAAVVAAGPCVAGTAFPASGFDSPGPPLASPGSPPASASFFGRSDELGALDAAAALAEKHGRPVVALVAGEAGAGKTALAEALTHRLTGHGWGAEWVRGPEFEGAPVAWPGDGDGREITTGETVPPAGAGDAAVERFRRHRAVAAGLAARAPVVLVADDLHRMDEDSLEVLTALVTGASPVRGTVLVLGTYRAEEIGVPLTATLARLARSEPVRVYLPGLGEAATAELVGSVARRKAPADAVRVIHRRSGGNPFFVRELARLWAAGAALGDIPAGVRDVIRHRLNRLPEPARTVLQQAAVLGLDIDPEVLAAIAGDQSPDALDAALEAGFLTEDDQRLRFTHVLVRDTLYDDLSVLRRSRWHALAGNAIERLSPGDTVALARHFSSASGTGAAEKAARYATEAAELAERRSNPHEAASWWRHAVAAHDRLAATTSSGGAERGRLVAIMGLGRALAVTGHLEETRTLRAEALDAVGRLGDPVLAATVVTAFDVPAVWPRNDDPALSGRIVAVVEELLGTAPPQLRGRLLTTLALELRGSRGDRGRRAAEEAETIARADRNPVLLALALNARYMHALERCGMAAERARIGAELVELAAENGLVTYEVLGHLILLQSACAIGDLAAADGYAEAADRLAERYDLPLVGVFTQLYAALRLAMTGDGRAEEVYRAACARLAAGGMPGVSEGLLGLCLLSLRNGGGRSGAGRSGRPAAQRSGGVGSGGVGSDGLGAGGFDSAGIPDLGPYEPWARPGLLLAAGRGDEAAAALRELPESPHDLLREARLCLAAGAAAEVGDREVAARLYAELLPAAGELAGAASGVLSFGPVDAFLARLRPLLGL